MAVQIKMRTSFLVVYLNLAGALAPLLVNVHDVVESVWIQVPNGILVGHDERRVVPERLAVALLG